MRFVRFSRNTENIKRMAAAFTAMMLLFCSAAFSAAEEEKRPSSAPWTGVTSTACRIYANPGDDSGIGRIPEGKRFRLYAAYPSWAYVEYDNIYGYIRRSCIDHADPVDAASTPPYGVDFYRYTGIVRDEAEVKSEPNGGETLITLYDGARVAFIGIENGWGKLIFKRQYGYIDTNLLSEIIPTFDRPEDAGCDEPIAAFVSFYKITDDEANIGRMANIAVACEKLSALLLYPGSVLDFNAQIGPYTQANGYHKAIVLVDGGTSINYGGGTCQVSSTLYNVVLQLPGLTVTQRRAHGPSGASYLPHGVDAAVGNKELNFKFRNDYPFPVRIDASSQDGALYISIYRVRES